MRRDYAAGHSDRAPRLDEAGWGKLVSHFKGLCERANSYGVRPVLHPHCGGYIEFGDEIDRLAEEIPNDLAGFVLDTAICNTQAWTRLHGCASTRTVWTMCTSRTYTYIYYDEVMHEHIRFFEGCAKGSMCPIGQGMIDYKAVADVLTRSATTATSPSSRNVIRARREQPCKRQGQRRLSQRDWI